MDPGQWDQARLHLSQCQERPGFRQGPILKPISACWGQTPYETITSSHSSQDNCEGEGARESRSEGEELAPWWQARVGALSCQQ